MGSKATTVEQQVEMLQNRGMELDMPTAKVKEILLDIGYYRLGFYWNPFEIDASHNFKVGTKFSNVIQLYYLDVDLRNLLQQYLNRVEIHFRTKVIYTVSNKHKGNPVWFVHPSVVTQNFIDDFDRKIYTPKFKKNNPAIKKHHTKYLNDRFAPAWKTIEFLTFGSVLTLFHSLREDNLKLDVASCFGIRNIKVFNNHMNNIVRLRNICSHGSLLYDTQLPIGIKTTPDLVIQGDDRKKLVAVIELLKYYVAKISTNRSQELNKKVDEIFSKHKKSTVLKMIIENKTGYKFVQ